MSIYDLDYNEAFGRNKPAIPRPPCEGCGEESLGLCAFCGARLCEDCVDWHIEREGW
jgi:hypothetical protein